MKIKDLLTPKEIELLVNYEDEKCNLCKVHEIAQERLPEPKHMCLACGKELQDDLETKYVVVGEHNGVDLEESIERRFIVGCRECRAHYMVELRPIMYNGNHDIFYTGGKHYLAGRIDSEELSKKVRDAITPQIEQYTERIRAGETALQPWNLVLWIERSIEKIVVGYLQTKREDGRV